MEATQLNQPATKAATHTPGPYFVDAGMIQLEQQIDCLREDAGTEREWIAIGPGDEETPDQLASVVALCHPSNARLIASAPELLAALAELAEACNQLPANDGRAIGLIPLIARAEAAIAKATT